MGGLVLLVVGLTWIGVTSWFRIALFAALRIQPTPREQRRLLVRVAALIAVVSVFSGLGLVNDSGAPRALVLVPITLGAASVWWFLVLLRDRPFGPPSAKELALVPARRQAVREGLRRPAVWGLVLCYVLLMPLLLIGLLFLLGAAVG
jgi:hypothetical protein